MTLSYTVGHTSGKRITAHPVGAPQVGAKLSHDLCSPPQWARTRLYKEGSDRQPSVAVRIGQLDGSDRPTIGHTHPAVPRETAWGTPVACPQPLKQQATQIRGER